MSDLNDKIAEMLKSYSLQKETRLVEFILKIIQSGDIVEYRLAQENHFFEEPINSKKILEYSLYTYQPYHTANALKSQLNAEKEKVRKLREALELFKHAIINSEVRTDFSGQLLLAMQLSELEKL